MRRTIGVLGTILAVALVASCSDGGERLVAGSGSADGPDPTSDPATGTPVGTPGGGPDGLVVSVEVGGGFVPVGHDFRSLPVAVVYEDGTTFSGGAHLMIFPGPAVRPVVKGQITDEQVRDLVAAAADAGLLDEEALDVGEPAVADAATTTVTVVVDGEADVTAVYALPDGAAPPPGGVDDQIGDPFPGLTDEQVAARRQVADFVAHVSSVVTGGESDLYVPERYRVLALPVSGEAGDGIEPEERAWPLPDVTLVEGECTVVSGAAAAALGEALAEADELTRWRTGTATFDLAVRPVLPHEPGCPA